jgi:ComF family protein
LRRLLAACVEILLPRACARCGGGVAGDRAFCAACAAATPRLPRDGCALCQAPYAGAAKCGACARERSPLAEIAAESPFEGEVAAWVHRFKYPRPGFAGLDPRPDAALASLVRDAARRLATSPDLVVPVPMHESRRRARGFHPAGELARAVARETGCALSLDALRATRETASQTGLDRGARRRNVRGAFAATRAFPRGARVALVDDVVTTGATLAECARVLRRAGAARVVAVCAARTL